MLKGVGNKTDGDAVIHHAVRLEVLGLQPEHCFKI
jgi:hypothetical protein